ncbi:hypothetical protein ACGLWX_03995 [Halomonas sp. HMF6819]|uniref:hypothetical protein n=1 Tax=Halomonas sp. HMF6819 TaxID=3373085 RepID=UPI003798A103
MEVHGAIVGERLITRHEYHYAKKVVATHRYLFWFLMGVGVLLFCSGVGLGVVIYLDDPWMETVAWLLIVFLVVGQMLGGAFIFWLGCKRRLRIDPHVAIIRGVLTVRKKRVPSNAGGVNYVNEYYIGNALLHGPPGSYDLLEKLNAHVIEVHALFLRMYPPLNLSKRYEGIDEALLFNLKDRDNASDRINLDGAFEKYGRKVFKRQAWRFNLLSLPPMFLSLGLAFYFIVKFELFTFWAFMGVLVASIIAGGLMYELLEVLYKKLRKGLDPDYQSLTPEEILKG